MDKLIYILDWVALGANLVVIVLVTYLVVVLRRAWKAVEKVEAPYPDSREPLGQQQTPKLPPTVRRLDASGPRVEGSHHDPAQPWPHLHISPQKYLPTTRTRPSDATPPGPSFPADDS